MKQSFSLVDEAIADLIIDFNLESMTLSNKQNLGFCWNRWIRIFMN